MESARLVPSEPPGSPAEEPPRETPTRERPARMIPRSFQVPNLFVDRLLPLLTPSEFVVLIYTARWGSGSGRTASPCGSSRPASAPTTDASWTGARGFTAAPCRARSRRCAATESGGSVLIVRAESRVAADWLKRRAAVLVSRAREGDPAFPAVRFFAENAGTAFSRL